MARLLSINCRPHTHSSISIYWWHYEPPPFECIRKYWRSSKDNTFYLLISKWLFGIAESPDEFTESTFDYIERYSCNYLLLPAATYSLLLSTNQSVIKFNRQHNKNRIFRQHKQLYPTPYLRYFRFRPRRRSTSLKPLAWPRRYSYYLPPVCFIH